MSRQAGRFDCSAGWGRFKGWASRGGLQEVGFNPAMMIELIEAGNGRIEIRLLYFSHGFERNGLEPIAESVNRVFTEQLQKLKPLAEKSLPSCDAGLSARELAACGPLHIDAEPSPSVVSLPRLTASCRVVDRFFHCFAIDISRGWDIESQFIGIVRVGRESNDEVFIGDVHHAGDSNRHPFDTSHLIEMCPLGNDKTLLSVDNYSDSRQNENADGAGLTLDQPCPLQHLSAIRGRRPRPIGAIVVVEFNSHH